MTGRVHALRRDYIVGEVEHILGSDAPDNIARRLGYSRPQHLARMLERAGRDDLASHFRRVAA